MKLFRKSLALFLLLVGCMANNQDQPSETPIENTDPDLSPTSPAFVYASGWTEMVIRANFCKTIVDTGAHFATNKNACGRDAYGAISMEDWNKLTTLTNQVLKEEPRQEDYCVPAPENSKYWVDESVQIKTPNSIHTIFEMKDWEICSRIKDQKTSDSLLAVINKLIEIADKEDCPNGWGS